MTQEKFFLALWMLNTKGNSTTRFDLLWKYLDPDPQAWIWDFVRKLPAEEKHCLQSYASQKTIPQAAYSTTDIGSLNGLGAFSQNNSEEAARHSRIITNLQTIT